MNDEQQHRICFLVLMGLPGSGKTTFSSYLVHCLSDSNNVNKLPFHCIIQVCYDKIIDPSTDTQWNEARKQISRNVDDAIVKLKKCIDPALVAEEHSMKIFVSETEFAANLRILVVIDDNMYYRSMRYQYYQIARTHQSSYCQLYLKCDVNECLRRNFRRNGTMQIPEHIILRMADNLEEPNVCNHPWESFSVSINSDKPFSVNSLSPLYTTIQEAFSHPVQPIPQNLSREHSQSICSSNVVHQADLILRKVIGDIIKREKQQLNCKPIQELSACLNIKKQELLQELKSGKLHTPEEIMKGVEEGDLCAISLLRSLLSEQFIKGIPQ